MNSERVYTEVGVPRHAEAGFAPPSTLAAAAATAPAARSALYL